MMLLVALVMQYFVLSWAARHSQFQVCRRCPVPRVVFAIHSRRHIISFYTIEEIPGTKWIPGYRRCDERQINCQRVLYGTPACLDRRPLEAGDSLVALRIHRAASLQDSSQEHAPTLTEGVDATIACTRAG